MLSLNLLLTPALPLPSTALAGVVDTRLEHLPASPPLLRNSHLAPSPGLLEQDLLPWEEGEGTGLEAQSSARPPVVLVGTVGDGG